MNSTVNDNTWLGFGLNHSINTVIVLGFYEGTKENAIKKFQEQQELINIIHVVNMGKPSARLREDILLCLAEENIYGTTASDIIQILARSIQKEFHKIAVFRE